MSWRIEESEALTVLRELPSLWAQTCVTRPPRDVPVDELIAALDEAARVVRADGTLWLSLPSGGNSQRILDLLAGETPWARIQRPWIPAGNVALFTKQARYLHQHRLQAPAAIERRRCASTRSGLARAPRRAFCVPASHQDRLFSEGLIDWCILTSTALQTCGVCGTPWQRIPAAAGHGESGAEHALTSTAGDAHWSSTPTAAEETPAWSRRPGAVTSSGSSKAKRWPQARAVV